MGKKITLACEVCKHKNYRVAKTLNERLIMNKFCNTCKKHVPHKEEK